MSAVKLHVFRGPDDGTGSCDYRGDGFIGSAQGDHHRTVAEIDPASPEAVDTVLSLGPSANVLFSALKDAQPDALGDVATALGLEGDGPVGLRIGLWDE